MRWPRLGALFGPPCFLAALFSKEEAVLLPVILVGLASEHVTEEGVTWDRTRALRATAVLLVRGSSRSARDERRVR